VGKLWGTCIAWLAFVSAAVSWAAPSQPVIVVPGIVGSKLCEAGPDGKPGKELWGAGLFYMGRLSQLTLPLQSGAAEKKIVPCGLLDSFGVLGPFDVDVYSGLVDFLKSAGYREGVDLFVFDYDWRRSNFETAEILKAKVAAVKAKTGKAQVALVAHSMGGIVSRAYLQASGGAPDVQTMVFFGTPHQGAPQVLRTAEQGWGFLPNWIVGGDDVIRETMFTWPSVYELLPLAKCCAVSQGLGEPEPFSLARASNWARFGWLPAKFKDAVGRAFLDRVIAQSLRARAMLDAALPSGPSYLFIASKAHKTAQTAVFTANFALISRYVEGPGDESVPVLSAANGALAQAHLVPQTHTALYDDEYAQYLLARALGLDMPALKAKFEARSGGRVLRFNRSSNATEACEGLTDAQKNPASDGGAQAVLMDDAGKSICIWAFELEAPRAAGTGETVAVDLMLGGFSASFWRALTPTVKVVGEDGKAVAEHNPTSAYASNTDGGFAARYRFVFTAPSKAGNYRLDLSQDGLADKSASRYIVVYGREGAAVAP
jgi:pimeloyl-ACP methyl ester carboxylesterase